MEKTLNKNESAVAPKTSGIYMLAIIMIALNMRFGITHFSSAMPLLEKNYGLTPSLGGIIGSIPLFCFAAGGIFANKIAASVGIKNTLLSATALMAIGFVIRSFGAVPMYIIGTLVAMLGLALCNIVLPSLIKIFYPHKVQMLTIIMSSAMAIGAFAGSGVNNLLTKSISNVPLTLIADAVIAGLAFLVVLAMNDKRLAKQPKHAEGESITIGQVARDPFAKVVTFYFALQALTCYSLLAWLPSLYVDAGIDHAKAGPLLGLVMLVGVPGFMILSKFIKSHSGLNAVLMLVALCMIVAMVWLLIAPAKAPVVVAVIIGVGLCSFPVMMSIITSYGESHHEVTALSSLAQSVGYLLAGLGPLLIGFIHQATGTWTLPVGLLIAVATLQFFAGIALMKLKDNK